MMSSWLDGSKMLNLRWQMGKTKHSPILAFETQLVSRSIFDWQCFQTFLVNLTRKIWKHGHSKIERDASCVSNANVGECCRFFWFHQKHKHQKLPVTLTLLGFTCLTLFPFIFFVHFNCFRKFDSIIFSKKMSGKSLKRIFIFTIYQCIITIQFVI